MNEKLKNILEINKKLIEIILIVFIGITIFTIFIYLITISMDKDLDNPKNASEKINLTGNYDVGIAECLDQEIMEGKCMNENQVILPEA